MTDKELLEYAARAAGIIGQPVWEGPEVGYHWVESYPMKDGYMRHYPVCWNPLRNDGDALRLAIQLHLEIATPLPHARFAMAKWWDESAGKQVHVSHHIEGKESDAFATVRAIVRAAAEIGKAML